MDCVVVARHLFGDHHLVVAQVVCVSASDGYPLVYWRRGLIDLCPVYRFIEPREAFSSFVVAWEAGTSPKAASSHAAHLAIGAYCAVQDAATAFERTKHGTCRYNEAVGTPNTDTSGYHETLTRFWANIIAEAVGGLDDGWEAARTMVRRFGEDRDLHTVYYSFDVVRDVRARQSRIPPDLDGSSEG